MVKIVGDCIYAHKSNLKELLSKVKAEDLEDVCLLLEMAGTDNIPFDVVKYSRKTGNVTLITSPDWDTKNEPIVGVCRLWKGGNFFEVVENKKVLASPKVSENFRQIYHNKWQFVGPDYSGFDIEKAKQRTKEWNSVSGIDKKRIGNYNYWVDFLKKNGLEE